MCRFLIQIKEVVDIRQIEIDKLLSILSLLGLYNRLDLIGFTDSKSLNSGRLVRSCCGWGVRLGFCSRFLFDRWSIFCGRMDSKYIAAFRAPYL